MYPSWMSEASFYAWLERIDTELAEAAQAISNLQGGFGGLAEHLGVGGAHDLGPGPGQAGLQTRAQLGLPDRRSYFTFLPSADDVAALGAVPGIPPTGGGKKALKKQKAGKPTTRHPEV